MDNTTHYTELPDVEAPQPLHDTSMVWSDARLLGFEPMDEEHREFYEVTRGLITCSAGSALEAVDAFEAHAVKHFGKEDEWMTSTEFPPRDCHMDEHAAVLKSVREVRQAVSEGRVGVDVVRGFGMHLFSWFPGHADYLDSALSAWMAKRAHGGKPVVLRRKLVD